MEKGLVGLKLQRVMTHTKLPNFRSYKTHFFCCLIFEEFENDFWIKNFIACCLGRHDQRVYLIFKIVPLGAPKPFIQIIPKWNEAFVGIDSLLTMITNSFKDPFIQKLGNIFIFCTEIYSLLKTLDKIKVTDASKTQVYLFHAHVDIKG